jgi:hypothetical protein
MEIGNKKDNKMVPFIEILTSAEAGKHSWCNIFSVKSRK